MRNFNDSSVIGGTTFTPGSKFDNFDLLIDRYYALLFYALTEGGITYNTRRNGVLSKVRLEVNGFVNYVQPMIGKWDYDDPKYKRLVSPDFVLYLFNNLCMAESLLRINSLVEPIKISQTEHIFHEGIDLNNFSLKGIIETYGEYAEEYYKYKNGHSNNYEKIPKTKLAFINYTYQLIERVTNYSSEFFHHQLAVAEANKLRHEIETGILSYEELSDEQQELAYNSYYSGEYESCPEFYMSLGCFNNNVRNYALKELYKEQEKLRKVRLTSKEVDLEKLGIYDNPIILSEYAEITGDLAEPEVEVQIDFTGAKEFEHNNTQQKEKKA